MPANIEPSGDTISVNGKDLTLRDETIGIGQTWQDVTVSRELDTDYTNDTGKPIELSIIVENTIDPFLLKAYFYIDVVLISHCIVTAVDQTTRNTINIIVPAGSVYKLTCVFGSINTWSELRS